MIQVAHLLRAYEAVLAPQRDIMVPHWEAVQYRESPAKV
jgi:hypothetical protein